MRRIPSKSPMQQLIYAHGNEGPLMRRIEFLIAERCQFAVSPFPQGINDTQEGWVLSFPPVAEDRTPPCRPEPEAA